MQTSPSFPLTGDSPVTSLFRDLWVEELFFHPFFCDWSEGVFVFLIDPLFFSGHILNALIFHLDFSGWVTLFVHLDA